MDLLEAKAVNTTLQVRCVRRFRQPAFAFAGKILRRAECVEDTLSVDKSAEFALGVLLALLHAGMHTRLDVPSSATMQVRERTHLVSSASGNDF